MIVKAVPEDHEMLTFLTKKSKAHWGYTKEQMAQWGAQLTISPEYIRDNEVYKLVVEGKIIGYYSFLPSENKNITLDNLFVDPEFMGKGFGKLLLADAIDKAQQLNFKTIILEADPNAENFYNSFGFVTSGKTETSVKERFLPVMQLSLA